MNTQIKSFNQALLAAMDQYERRSCFRFQRGKRYQKISYRQFRKRVFQLTHFFRQQGITNGERVALIAHNSLEWILAYVAGLLSGGVVVPLHTSLTSDMVITILKDSGASLVVLQNDEHINIVLDALAQGANECWPELETVIIIASEMPIVHSNLSQQVYSMADVLKQHHILLPEDEAEIRTHAANIAPHALSWIYYVTSKGQPKGAVFDHGQGLMVMKQITEWFTFAEDELAITVRNWSEPPILTISLHYFLSGVANVVLDENNKNVVESMQQTSPTVMLATPHSFELFYELFMNWLGEQPESNQKVFQWALAKGREYWEIGSEMASDKLREEYIRADMTFFSQLRGQIGGRMRYLYSTGASLSQELAEFYEAIGLPVLNVYSIVETGGFPTASLPNTYNPASCGRVAPGFEVRIADDGEVLVQGETMMRGYWLQPEETEHAFDADGWLHSGDFGFIDEHGYLHITGRKQHLMVLSIGRKIARGAIEDALTSSSFIIEAVAFGDGKPYVSAMIMPDRDKLVAYFQNTEDQPYVTSTTHPKVKALLDEEIRKINNKLDNWEQIREYTLLDEPLTPTSIQEVPPATISRHVVAEQYADKIDAMYPMIMQLEIDNMTHVQVEPDRLRELLDKERLLDAWMADAGIEFLFAVAREKQIDAPSMVHICDVVASITQMESEEKPLSTALIVGDPAHIARILPESQIQLLQHDHIRRMRHVLVTLAKMVDGLVLGYVVDKYGYVRGIHRLEISLDDSSGLLMGPQFRHHAAISRECDAVVFFAPSGGRHVRVFANGQLVGRYSNGDWSPDNMPEMDEVVARLVEQKKYHFELVQRILRCAFQMSEKNLGAIFLLGDSDLILERSDSSEITSMASILSVELNQLSDQELINFAKQDGATIIDNNGQFRGCMILLRPTADTKAEIGPGKGARHSSAAKMSAEAQCLAFTISQDGPITVYESGRRILSL